MSQLVVNLPDRNYYVEVHVYPHNREDNSESISHGYSTILPNSLVSLNFHDYDSQET